VSEKNLLNGALWHKVANFTGSSKDWIIPKELNNLHSRPNTLGLTNQKE
jgi:hypothetical protein